MSNPKLNNLDFNLLLDLDVLLREGSVASAARSLHLSAPAMSRRLARLRDAIGDPLFVPAGRGLVPTQRALALRERIQSALEEIRGIFTSTEVNFRSLRRRFVLRSNDGFAGTWATHLTAALKAEAPGVSLEFMPRVERGIEALRSGAVDLDIGVNDLIEPEMHAGTLFKASFAGIMRSRHPLIRKKGKTAISVKDLLTCEHVATSPQGHLSRYFEAALRESGLQRKVAITAPGFQSALVMVASSDLVAMMPEPFAYWAADHLSLHIFRLPMPTPFIEIKQMWHARQDADHAHRWLRAHVLNACEKLAKRK